VEHIHAMSRNQLTQLGFFGSTGAVIGILYELLQHVSTESPPELCTTFQFLHADPQVIFFLHNIETTIAAEQRIAYLRLVNAIDEMVGLKIEITQPAAKPMIKHRILGRQLLSKMRDSMRRLVDETRQSDKISASNAIRIHGCVRNLYTIVESYYAVIYAATREDRIRC
jgi:hypothetical protein